MKKDYLKPITDTMGIAGAWNICYTSPDSALNDPTPGGGPTIPIVP